MNRGSGYVKYNIPFVKGGNLLHTPMSRFLPLQREDRRDFAAARHNFKSSLSLLCKGENLLQAPISRSLPLQREDRRDFSFS
jgi:hypothetical protein